MASIDITTELLDEFLDEAAEHLATLEEQLQQLESSAATAPVAFNTPEKKERMNDLFRAAHSLKGLSAAFGFVEMNRLNHALEAVFDQARMGTRKLGSAAVAVLQAARCEIATQVAELSAPSGRIPQTAELIAQLTEVFEGTHEGPPAEAAPLPATPARGSESPPELGGPLMTNHRLRAGFLQTVDEDLDRLSDRLIQLQDEADDALLRDAARIAHTMKGSFQAAGLQDAGALTDHIEKALNRAGQPAGCAEGAMEPLLAIAGQLRHIVELVEEGTYRPLDEDNLARWIRPPSRRTTPATPPPSTTSPRANTPRPSAAPPQPEPVTVAAAPQFGEQGAGLGGELALCRAHYERLAVDLEHAAGLPAALQRCAAGLDRLADIEHALESQNAAPAELAAEVGAVRALLADVCHHLELTPLPRIQDAVATLGELTRRVEHSVTAARMEPVGPLLIQSQRCAQEVAEAQGKRVNGHVDGQQIALDRNSIAILAAPLADLMRNAVEHGIESPTERGTAGKPGIGRIELTAFREGERVGIRVRDDGRGVDLAALRERIVEQHILPAAAARHLADHDALQYLLHPGLGVSAGNATAAVGLPRVAARMAQLNGAIDIESTAGHGTTVTIRLPDPMTVINAHLIRVGDEQYALPAAAVAETVTVHAAQLHTVHHRAMVDIRGHMMPLVTLDDCMGRTPATRPGVVKTVMVIALGDHRLGLCIDQWVGTEEIVIKSLESRATWRGVVGAALTADHGMSLILDPLQVLDHVGCTPGRRDVANARPRCASPD